MAAKHSTNTSLPAHNVTQGITTGYVDRPMVSASDSNHIVFVVSQATELLEAAARNSSDSGIYKNMATENHTMSDGENYGYMLTENHTISDYYKYGYMSTENYTMSTSDNYGYMFTENHTLSDSENNGYMFTGNYTMSTGNNSLLSNVEYMTVTVEYNNSNCHNGCMYITTEAPSIQINLLHILIAFVLSLFIICIIIGNILVISSVILFRDMRTLTNVLIASLAIADLLVALIVLPISLHFEIKDHVWTLGPIVCDFWITSDVFCCTASILNIVVIAMDRYWLITRNVRYTHNVRFPRKRVCLVMVFLAWLLSTVISVSPLFGWTAGSEKTDVTCVISQDLGYTVFSTFGAFWFPLSVILITYFNIFKVARKRARCRQKSRSICPSINTSCLPTETQNCGLSSVKRNSTRHSDSCETTPPHSVRHRDHTTNTEAVQTQQCEELTSNHMTSPSNESTYFVQETDVSSVNNNTYMETAIHSETETFQVDNSSHMQQLPESKLELANGNTQVLPNTKANMAGHERTNGSHSSVKQSSANFKKKSSSSQGGYFRRKTRRQFHRLGQCSSRMRRRNKIRSSARTLGLIIGCFVICWMPFFLLASVLPFCQVCTDNVPIVVQSITLWLGYSNSLLNPAIYAIWDKNFRRSFKKVIKCHINWSYVFYN